MKYSKRSLLKKMINEFINHRDRSITSPEILNLYYSNKSAYSEFEYMKSENLIDFDVDPCSGEMISLQLLDGAILYFNYTRKDNFRFWIPIIISIILSVASLIVSVVAIVLNLSN